jgi:hypothetical protein
VDDSNDAMSVDTDDTDGSSDSDSDDSGRGTDGSDGDDSSDESRVGSSGAESSSSDDSESDESLSADEDDAEFESTHPGLLGIFNSVVVSCQRARPLTDLADYTKALLGARPAAERKKAFNNKGKVRYTSRPTLFAIMHVIAEQVRRAIQHKWAQADFFAVSGDLCKPEHMTTSLLSVCVYRATARFARVCELADIVEVGDTTAQGVVAKVRRALVLGVGLTRAAISAKCIMFLSDGGSNFAGIFKGARQVFKTLHAPNSLPGRCASHIIERIMTVIFAAATAPNQQYHPTYYVSRALDTLANKQTKSPYTDKIERRIGKLYKKDVAEQKRLKAEGQPSKTAKQLPRRVSKQGDTR